MNWFTKFTEQLVTADIASKTGGIALKEKWEMLILQVKVCLSSLQFVLFPKCVCKL